MLMKHVQNFQSLIINDLITPLHSLYEEDQAMLKGYLKEHSFPIVFRKHPFNESLTSKDECPSFYPYSKDDIAFFISLLSEKTTWDALRVGLEYHAALYGFHMKCEKCLSFFLTRLRQHMSFFAQKYHTETSIEDNLTTIKNYLKNFLYTVEEIAINPYLDLIKDPKTKEERVMPLRLQLQNIVIPN